MVRSGRGLRRSWRILLRLDLGLLVVASAAIWAIGCLISRLMYLTAALRRTGV